MGFARGTIDAVTLGLLIVAVVPWLTPIVKSFEIGGFKAELREVKSRVGELQDRVERVEEEFIFTGQSTPLQRRAQTQLLNDFRDYLTRILTSIFPTSTPIPPTTPTVHVNEGRQYDAWVDPRERRLIGLSALKGGGVRADR
jgi:hypothetical protein